MIIIPRTHNASDLDTGDTSWYHTAKPRRKLLRCQERPRATVPVHSFCLDLWPVGVGLPTCLVHHLVGHEQVEYSEGLEPLVITKIHCDARCGGELGLGYCAGPLRTVVPPSASLPSSRCCPCPSPDASPPSHKRSSSSSSSPSSSRGENSVSEFVEGLSFSSIAAPLPKY